MHGRAPAQAFVGAALAGGAAAFALAGGKAVALPPATLALLTAAVIVAELLEVSPPPRSLDPPGGNFSFSSGIHMGTVLLLGPWAAVLVAGAGVLAVDGLRGVAWRKIGFNASVFALASLAGGSAFLSLGGSPGSVELPGDILPITGLLASYVTVNAVLVSLAVALHSRARLAAVLRSAIHPGASLAEGAIAVCLALLAERNPWDVLALVPLLVVAYQALARLALLHAETARALETLATVVDERDPSTFRHSERVARSVRALAEALHLPPAQVARLAWAGRLHDLGKIAVDASILRKAGRLDPDEWELVRRHPRISARLLRHFSLVSREAQAVEYHHERFDGQGYYGVGDRHLPLSAHLLAVADAFDAITSDRPYRAALSEEAGLAEIERGSGSQFHPLVARAFVALRRGQDLGQALARAERRSLARGLRGARAPDLPSLAGTLRQGAGLATALIGLLLLGAGRFLAGAVLLAVALLALAAVRLERWRGRRLGRRLGQLLQGSCDPVSALGQAAEILAGHAPVRWAAVIRWEERLLHGALVREWGWPGARPDSTALTSWLVRDAERGDELLVCPGSHLGRAGTYAALPLQAGEGDAIRGFLVLAFARPVSPTVETALRACAGLPARALDRPGLVPIPGADLPPLSATAAPTT